jgi:amidase
VPALREARAVATFISRLDQADGATTRVAVKDLIDVEGVPTTAGSRVVAASAQAAAKDAACLAGTRAAQATIVGKTNLHELAFGVTGINPWFGTPVNPLDPGLVPGGSSSGSAVAVANGDADVAFGSDTGGSIRIPAACCGVVGLKTTRGRVSLEGVMPLAASLDTVGPMATTVAGVTAGMALLEPGFSLDGKEPAATIGRVRLPAKSWIDEALDSALDSWSSSTGSKVVDVVLPGWAGATHAVMTILSGEAWQTYSALWQAHGQELSPDVARRLELASLLDKEEVASAWEVAREWVRELRGVFGSVDLVALPTLADEPPPLDKADRLAEIRYVAPFNLAGIPALSLPVRSRSRLPAALQLAGPAGSEEVILATAAAVEASLE